jgi:DNA-binding response OmpR family regulator
MKLFRFKKPVEEKPVIGEIVIIDDTPENLHLLNDILSESGYKVRALPNGEMGLSACRASPPDLILLDINMPGKDGYQVAEELKADASCKHVPIIFISAMNQTEDKVRAFDAGGVDYVTKPLQVEEVKARVETHLSISRMRDQINQANEKLLTWAVEMSQPATATPQDCAFRLPEGLAAIFGKPTEALKENDRAEASVSVLAVCSPSADTLTRVEDELSDQHNGCTVARFSNILVAVSPDETEAIAQWLESSFSDEDLTVSLNAGEGLLQIVPADSGMRLDFVSSSVLESLAALVEN